MIDVVIAFRTRATDRGEVGRKVSYVARFARRARIGIEIGVASRARRTFQVIVRHWVAPFPVSKEAGIALASVNTRAHMQTGCVGVAV